MPVTHDDLLKFAESNCGSADEVERRAAASRAYYSIYHYIRGFDFIPPAVFEEKTGVHSKLIRALTTSPDTNTRAVGYMVQQAHSMRTSADYHLADSFSDKNAKLVIELVSKVKSRLDDAEQTAS